MRVAAVCSRAAETAEIFRRRIGAVTRIEADLSYIRAYDRKAAFSALNLAVAPPILNHADWRKETTTRGTLRPLARKTPCAPFR